MAGDKWAAAFAPDYNLHQLRCVSVLLPIPSLLNRDPLDRQCRGTPTAVSVPDQRHEGRRAAPAGVHIHLCCLACPVVSLQLKKQARWERCAEPFCKESSPGHPSMIYTIIHNHTVTRQKQMQQRRVMTQVDLDGPPYVDIFITPHSLQPLYSELTSPPAH